MDPIHQFEITNFFVFGKIGGVEFAFTKSALFMLISFAIIALLMIGATSARAMVPGRLQGVAEMSYEFVASTLQSTAGPEGMKILPLVSFIEVLSFLSRPVSHSVRLFANILAGHITLKVFAGFVTMLSAFGVLGWVGAILPLGMTVALTALELLVAFLQAYVFAILTCI